MRRAHWADRSPEPGVSERQRPNIARRTGIALTVIAVGGLGVLAGFFVADDANEVQDLRDEAVSLSEDLDQDESELTKSQAAQADVEAVVADCVEASGAIAGLLAASIDEMAGAYDAFAETPVAPRAAAGRRLRLRSQGIIEPPDRVPGRPVSCLAKRQPLASCDEDTLVLLLVLELGGIGWNRRTADGRHRRSRTRVKRLDAFGRPWTSSKEPSRSSSSSSRERSAASELSS